MFLQLKGEAVRVMTSRLLAVGTTLAVLLLIASPARAGLVAGDIAIIGVNTDAPDAFAWFPLVDLPAGTAITFTDAGWTNVPDFSPNEGFVTFTAPSGGLAAGTVQIYEIGETNVHYTSRGNFSLHDAGDQVIAFSENTESRTFLFAVQTNSSQFQTTWLSGAESTLPPGLEVGLTAVAVGKGPGPGDEVDNAYYTGTTISGTREELLLAIADASNWTKVEHMPRIDDLTNGVSNFTVQSGVSAVPEGNGLVVGSAVLAIAAVAGVVGLRRRRAVRVSAPELQPVI